MGASRKPIWHLGIERLAPSWMDPPPLRISQSSHRDVSIAIMTTIGFMQKAWRIDDPPLRSASGDARRCGGYPALGLADWHHVRAWSQRNCYATDIAFQRNTTMKLLLSAL